MAFDIILEIYFVLKIASSKPQTKRHSTTNWHFYFYLVFLKGGRREVISALKILGAKYKQGKRKTREEKTKREGKIK